MHLNGFRREFLFECRGCDTLPHLDSPHGVGPEGDFKRSLVDENQGGAEVEVAKFVPAPEWIQ